MATVLETLFRIVSKLSYAYMPLNSHKNYDLLNDKLIKTSTVTAQSSNPIKLIGWKSRKFSSNTDDIRLPAGVYVIAANFITSKSGTSISFDMRIEEKILFTNKYYTKTNKLFTFLLAGVVVLKTSAAVVSFYMNSKEPVSIHAKSSISVAYLSSQTEKHPLILLKVTDNESHNWIIDKWMLIKAFVVDINIDFFYHDSILVPRVTGVYFISAHIIASVVER